MNDDIELEEDPVTASGRAAKEAYEKRLEAGEHSFQLPAPATPVHKPSDPETDLLLDKVWSLQDEIQAHPGFRDMDDMARALHTTRKWMPRVLADMAHPFHRLVLRYVHAFAVYVFTRWPEVQQLRWHQKTDFYNDGSPVQFRIYPAAFEVLVPDDVTPVRHVWRYQINDKRLSRDVLARFVGYKKTVRPDDFTETFDIREPTKLTHAFRHVLGEQSRVTVTRDRIITEAAHPED